MTDAGGVVRYACMLKEVHGQIESLNFSLHVVQSALRGVRD